LGFRELRAAGAAFPRPPGRTGFNGLLAGSLEPREELRGAAEHKLLGLGAVVATPSSSVPLSPFLEAKDILTR